jgi:hypothetical protein
MGQYQQWLHSRAVDQQLQTQLEMLENELAQLLDRAQPVEQCEQTPQDAVSSAVQFPEDRAFDSSFLATNKIILALAAVLDQQAPSQMDYFTSSTAAANQQVPVTDQSAETISSTLFAWSNLPNFETPNISIEPAMYSTSNFNPNHDQLQPPTPHQEFVLLPEDMSSFIDEHSLTDPQIELPWWLHNIAVVSRTNNSNGPIDRESIRTNRLVQRWLERWGRQPTPHNQQGENNHE